MTNTERCILINQITNGFKALLEEVTQRDCQTRTELITRAVEENFNELIESEPAFDVVAENDN